ncbi:hypothetical protein KJ359_001793 [Pestalotiopsis sp. 9143b]|nr:hypothetical protein KJ359_001793 [Pestalotiopsis sp. 9143b]
MDISPTRLPMNDGEFKELERHSTRITKTATAKAMLDKLDGYVDRIQEREEDFRRYRLPSVLDEL